MNEISERGVLDLASHIFENTEGSIVQRSLDSQPYTLYNLNGTEPLPNPLYLIYPLG